MALSSATPIEPALLTLQPDPSERELDPTYILSGGSFVVEPPVSSAVTEAAADAAVDVQWLGLPLIGQSLGSNEGS